MLIRRVVGESMLPAYRPGAIIVGVSRLKPRKGSVVVAELDGREIIKRVARVGRRGFYLLGDNSNQSTDSRKYGWFPPKLIKGVVIGSLGRW